MHIVIHIEFYVCLQPRVKFMLLMPLWDCTWIPDSPFIPSSLISFGHLALLADLLTIASDLKVLALYYSYIICTRSHTDQITLRLLHYVACYNSTYIDTYIDTYLL